ncbi:hypothetical protein [Methylocystis sp. ATCC 49242]|uniref:hypothetical protein n=1 Tax=Methylocystis sp. ATCC 49242 TaxID=622637 RepID=UPI0001F875C6|nr:hypothetical protein [Methylocystis sp. ATCC 49242]
MTSRLAALGRRPRCSTILAIAGANTQIAKELCEPVCWLFDVAAEMEPENGLIWVHGITDDGVMAFTDCGIDYLVELIKMRKLDRTLLSR